MSRLRPAPGRRPQRPYTRQATACCEPSFGTPFGSMSVGCCEARARVRPHPRLSLPFGSPRPSSRYRAPSGCQAGPALRPGQGRETSSSRRRWASATAMAPSPTAPATRLVEPLRASPAAKSPGTLVSSGNGSRSSGQPAGRRPWARRSGPVEQVARPIDEDAGAGRPAGAGDAADAQEQRAGRQPLGRPLGVDDRDRGEGLPARVHLRDLRAEADVDEVAALDALDEVRGHGLPEPIAADEHRHPGAVVRQVQNGLAGRVAGADHDDLVVRAPRGLAAAGAVVDTTPEKLLHSVHAQPPPFHPRRRERDGSGELGAAVELRLRSGPPGPAGSRPRRGAGSARRRISRPASRPSGPARRPRSLRGSRRSSRSSTCGTPALPGDRAR